jgi:hypothetical protein
MFKIQMPKKVGFALCLAAAGLAGCAHESFRLTASEMSNAEFLRNESYERSLPEGMTASMGRHTWGPASCRLIQDGLARCHSHFRSMGAKSGSGVTTSLRRAGSGNWVLEDVQIR